MVSVASVTKPMFGELWMAHLLEQGSVQGGYRPVFIISNDLNNKHSPTVNVIPITSRGNKRRLPIHVSIVNYAECGLKRPSTMLVEQISTINADDLDCRIGKITDPDLLREIKEAIEIQFSVFAS